MELFEELEQEGIDRGLLEAIRAFRAEHPVPQEAQGRLIRPKLLYYGREVWQAAPLLCCAGKTCSSPAQRPREKTCWRKIWPPPLGVPCGTCLCM